MIALGLDGKGENGERMRIVLDTALTVYTTEVVLHHARILFLFLSDPFLPPPPYHSVTQVFFQGHKIAGRAATRGSRTLKETSFEVCCEADKPAFEPEGLAFYVFAEPPPPMALDATAITSGAVT